MTDYSKMSDLVINGLVMDALSDENQYHRPGSGNEIELLREVHSVELGEHVVSDQVAGVFDPCNSWADAGPIIAKSHIAIIWLEHEAVWEASASYVIEEGCWDWESEPSHYHLDASQLRAAMIVFLMMKDAEKEQGNG